MFAHAYTVTPSDTVPIGADSASDPGRPCDALYISGAGNVVVRAAVNDDVVTYVAVPAGTWLWVHASFVMAATAATGIIAHWGR